MFVVNDDLSIYATRGDIVCLNVSATDDSTGGDYEFQPGDIVRMKIFGKKDAESIYLSKDFPVVAKTYSVGVMLTEQDTKIGEVISKPTDYWYEIELNPYTNPQTIVGYDEDGAKIFKLFPEGKDLVDEPTDPEDIPVVDTDLDLTSSRPVENKAIARAVTLLKNDLETVDARLTGKIKENKTSAKELNEALLVERARIDNLLSSATADDSEVVDIRVGADGETYASAGTAVREQFGNMHSIIDGIDEFFALNPLVNNVNKYNKDDRRNKENVFVNLGGYVEATGYGVTHPIYVKRGCTYKMPFADSMGENTAVIYTDINGAFISSANGELDGEYIVFTPTKSGYVAFNLGNASGTKESFMVCIADEYTEEYVPFINPFIAYADNPLLNKTISFNGDSICAGAGFEGGYGKIIATNNNMVYENVAVGGGTITAETYVGETERHWVCRTVENMNADADYAIFEGGVNDAALNIPLGTLSAGYSDELDETTYIGAFESMLKQAVIRFAGKKIGYIAVHKMISTYDSRYKENSYYYAAKECCEKWGVPFLDLNTQTPRFISFATLANSFTHNGDGWHPNEAGYMAYYVPKIEAWLKTL